MAEPPRKEELSRQGCPDRQLQASGRAWGSSGPADSTLHPFSTVGCFSCPLPPLRTLTGGWKPGPLAPPFPWEGDTPHGFLKAVCWRWPPLGWSMGNRLAWGRLQTVDMGAIYVFSVATSAVARPRSVVEMTESFSHLDPAVWI